MNHLIAYEGKKVALAVMQREYGREFLPWPNRRQGVEGTHQRPPYYPETFEKWHERIAEKREEVFAVLERNSSDDETKYRYLGHTSIFGISWPSAYGTTGTILGASDARGKGYGTEAKLLLQYHAFRVVGLRKLSSEVKAFNGASMAHLLRCGYRYIGTRQAHDFHDGGYVDAHLFECLREYWEPVWDAYSASGKELPELSDEDRAFVMEKVEETKR